ncbi:C2H2 transcription factor [Xylariales sp. AK1849]|nr:C2H2 transcription factor [Xylariales sp. AK1849]
MMNTASGPFYSQTVPADLNGSLWDAAAAEGAQNFHGDSDFSFSFGHITPRGNGQDQNEDEIKWIAAEEAPAVVAEPMRRMNSHSSAGSQKNMTTKATSQKSRPRILSSVSSQGTHMSNFDMTGNAQMDAYLLQDSDAHSVSSQMFYPTLPMGVGLTADGLPYSGVLASGMAQQHMDPAQMQLDFAPSLTGNSPTASWSGSLSPIESESRISSPGIPEEAWNNVPVGTSSPHGSDSSHIMDAHSPSHHPGNHLVITEDVYGNDLLENALMPPAFTRRSSGEGESSARDHPLYKNAMPKAADGLFHCPWEGHASCNHKAEKLKCNYDKFVDSHLKPYRCKIDSCENARFSSTACLLRHEREAHAMHGHGDKPYLCTYEGCDRAIPGCGFPRNWNLRDHMRRVHNDNGQSLSQSNGSHLSSRGSHSSSTKGRKRKSKDESTSSGRKSSSKSTSADEAAAAVRAAAERPLIQQWWEHRNALASYVERMNDPTAFEMLDQTGEAGDHIAAMDKITRRLKKTREPHRRSYLHQSG